MVWWLLSAGLVAPSGPAWAGTTAQLASPGALGPCARDPVCGARVGEAVADELRAAAMGAEAFGMGMSPAVVRGTGGLLELSAQSLAMPNFVAPAGVGLAPAIPRVGLGGVGGSRVRVGGGVELGAAVPTQSSEVGFGGGAHLGVVVGDPSGRRWVGFEVDAGIGVVQGQLVDQPRQVAQEELFAGVPIEVVDCGVSCLDQAILGYAGVDTVMAYDIDSTTVIGLRLGGGYQAGDLEIASTRSRWTFSGVSPRAGLLAAYRPHPRAIVGLGARLAILRPAQSSSRTRLPWTGAMTFGWRFGVEAPAAAPPPPLVPAPVPAAPAPVVVQKISVVEHPELQCEGNRMATGVPPPMGLMGWCVTVTDAGVVVADGLFIEWHDEEHIRRRGMNENGLKTGQWTEYDPQGVLVSQGTYVEGLEEGIWTTYEGGRAKSEGRFVRGKEVGQWMYWTSDGGSLTGEWVNGRRDGLWREYDSEGRVVRERFYRDDMLQSEAVHLSSESPGSE
jgi:hypothetical protein